MNTYIKKLLNCTIVYIVIIINYMLCNLICKCVRKIKFSKCNLNEFLSIKCPIK